MSAASRAQEEESSRHVRHLVRIDKRERGRKGREGEEREGGVTCGQGSGEPQLEGSRPSPRMTIYGEVEVNNH